MIGIIGGTGPQGKGLAYRLAVAGRDVAVGSRSAERGAEVADALTAEMLSGASGSVVGMANADLPGACETLIVAVPYEGLSDTLAPMADAIDGHLILSAVNNLGFKGGPHPLPVPAGSSAQEIADLLPGARVVTAFNNVAAGHLNDAGHAFDEDVLVCGDDAEARAAAVEIVDAVEGLRGVAAGGLVHAFTIEAMTAVIISINKSNKITGGIRVTGL